MSISATAVKDLREKTGAGMMDCKKALSETNGDFEKAVEWLRVKGLSAASKKAGRVAAEGLVHAYIHTGQNDVLARSMAIGVGAFALVAMWVIFAIRILVTGA